MRDPLLEKVLIEKNIRPTAVRLRVLKQFRSDIIAASLNELEEELKPVDANVVIKGICKTCSV